MPPGRTYWRDMGPPARRLKLLEQWQSIGEHLDAKMPGALVAIPTVDAHSSGADLKACEDIIDAMVCAWVATTALDGKAIRYGDADAAIWIPMPQSW